MLTPYLEQSTVYNQLDLEVPLYCPPSFPPSFVHPNNVQPVACNVDTFRCPAISGGQEVRHFAGVKSVACPVVG